MNLVSLRVCLCICVRMCVVLIFHLRGALATKVKHSRLVLAYKVTSPDQIITHILKI